VIYDTRGNFRAYVDARKSFVEPILQVNSDRLGPAHSSAILDDRGNAYFFHQKGDRRMLMKNGQVLTSFRGYYGKPVDIGRRGEVYFIGASLSGASLFVFDRGEIFRMTDSDVVIDARQIDRDEFLVAEITTQG